MKKILSSVLIVLFVVSLCLSCDISNQAIRRPPFGDLSFPPIQADVTELVGTYEVLSDNSYLPKGRLYSFSELGEIISVPYGDEAKDESEYWEGSYRIDGTLKIENICPDAAFTMSVENGNRVLKGDATIILKKLSDDCIDVGMFGETKISGFWKDVEADTIYWFRNGRCQIMVGDDVYGTLSRYTILGGYNNIVDIPYPAPGIKCNFCYVGDTLVLGTKWLPNLMAE